MGTTGQRLRMFSVFLTALLALATGAQAADLIVDGVTNFTGSSSASYDTIKVGDSSPGTLTIQDSAVLTCGSGAGEWSFIVGYQKEGTLNLSGGTLTHSTGQPLWLGWPWGAGRGVMNISGGTANVGGPVRVWSGELDISGGTLNAPDFGAQLNGVSHIAISGGTADLYSINIDDSRDTFSLTGGNLNLGAGGLYGAGTINFGGGTLKLNNNGAIALDFDADRVEALFFDGVPQATGTWGKTGSGADHINDTYFTGTGVLTVVRSVPMPNFLADHAISLDKASGYATLTLEATTGFLYRVVHKDNLLATGEWQTVTPPAPNGWTNSGGPTITLTDTNASGVQRRFYRIEAKPTDAP